MLECSISTGEIGRYTNERSNSTLNVRYQPSKVVGDYTTTHKVEITYGLAFNKRATCNDLLKAYTIYLKTKSVSKNAQYISKDFCIDYIPSASARSKNGKTMGATSS